MSSNLRKRKSHLNRNIYSHSSEEYGVGDLDPSLFIQAHEADLLRGPRAQAAAHSLETTKKDDKIVFVGEALIKWRSNSGQEDENLEEVWVDRYDARLLLDTLPQIHRESVTERYSPTGWSDLPSDAEDTFFLSTDETEDYRRAKRRRLIDQAREDRLRSLREERDNEEPEDPDPWGGSDEEPDDEQKELMRRTATHLSNSPNAAQLEMRILANHGADRRFAFLRGRWSRNWRLTKELVRLEKEKEQENQSALDGLTGYGDSDSDSDGQEKTVSAQAGTQDSSVRNDDEIKAARRAKAKEWAASRRALKAQADSEQTN
ncbi:hypothetical protein ABKN59_004543 [Abortiporus biennis]